MRLRYLLSRTRDGFVMAALLCVLAARIAVPAGWMPVAGVGGGVLLAPCSGMGAMTVAVHSMPGMEMAGAAHVGHGVGDKGDPRHPDPAGDHPCSGAGMSAVLDLAAIAFAPVPPMPSATPIAAAYAGSVGHGLAAPPPPQTGPPILI